MPDPFAPPTDPRANYTESDWTLTSGLTVNRYPFARSNRKDTLRRLLAEDTEEYAVLDHRLTPALGGKPSAQQCAQHLQKGDLLKVDSRSLAEQVAQDGMSRSNAVKDESDFGGNPIREGADLDNERLWNTPAKRAMRDKLRASADTKDAQQAELEAQAAEKAERESNQDWKIACAEVRATISVLRMNPATDEATLAAAAQVLTQLESGQLSISDYQSSPLTLPAKGESQNV